MLTCRIRSWLSVAAMSVPSTTDTAGLTTPLMTGVMSAISVAPPSTEYHVRALAISAWKTSRTHS